MKTKNIKYFCFGLMMVAVCASAIQKAFHIFSVPHLYGASVYTDKPKFKIEDWISNYYQINYEKNLEENFGFRNDLVRLNNQLDYSIFRKSNSNEVVIGKKGYLFQQGYIDAYLGKKSLTEDGMQQQLNVLQQLSDSIEKHDTKLVVVLAPGKASFFPEYLPSFDFKKTKNNYEKILALKNNYTYDIVDLNAEFLNLKNKTQYPLYSQQGIHWTNYGAYLGMDKLIKHIEAKTKINLPDYHVAGFIEAIKPNTDYDLGELLNVIYELPHYRTFQPKIVNDSNIQVQPKLNVLFVGDSYFWNLEHTKLIQHVFANYNFWYYSKSIYPVSTTTPTPVLTLNIVSKIHDYDYVIFVQTEQNYDHLGFDFAGDYLEQTASMKNYRDTLNYYFLNNSKSKFSTSILNESNAGLLADSLVNFKYDKIAEIIKTMYDKNEWLEQLKQKAKSENVSLERKVKDDALWIFEKDFDITKK